jgi:RecJ-like exonuclease
MTCQPDSRRRQAVREWTRKGDNMTEQVENCSECRGTGVISAQNCASCEGKGRIIVHSHDHRHGETVHDHPHPHPGPHKPGDETEHHHPHRP